MLVLSPHLLLLPFLFLLGFANADWKLSITYANGKQITAHGFRNSGCEVLAVSDSPVATFYLEGNINVDTVAFYTDTMCRNGEYKRGTGSTNVNPDQYFKAYKTW